MSLFIQHDEDNKVLAVLTTDEDTVDGFIKVSGEIPKQESSSDVLLYSDVDNQIYFGEDETTETYKLMQENASLKKRMSELEAFVKKMAEPGE